MSQIMSSRQTILTSAPHENVDFNRNKLNPPGRHIIYTESEFNSPYYSNYTCFTFKSISDGLSYITTGSDHGDANSCMGAMHLMRSCLEEFRDCLAECVVEITIYTKTHFSRFTKCGFLLVETP